MFTPNQSLVTMYHIGLDPSMFEKVNLSLSLFSNTVAHLDTTTRNQHPFKLKRYQSFSPEEI